MRGYDVSSLAIRTRRTLRTYRSGRVCSEAPCVTRLSRYNPSDSCYLHAPSRRVRMRGEFTETYLDKRGTP